MFTIDKFSRQPIYEQIISQVETLILLGDLPPETQLPSVRQLAVELSVNPNTLQKAYMELERRGLTVTSPGNGRYIAPNAPEILRQSKASQLSELQRIAQELAQAGISLEDAISAVKTGYANAQGGNR